MPRSRSPARTSISSRSPAAPQLPDENTAINGYVLSHKDTLKGIFAVDAGSTQTVGQIVGKYGLADKVASGGFDLTPQTLQSVKAGNLDFTIDQSPYQQGFLPVIGLYLFQLSGGLVSPSDHRHRPDLRGQDQRGSVHADHEPVRGLQHGAEADQAVRRDLRRVTGSGHRRARARRWPPRARPLPPLAAPVTRLRDPGAAGGAVLCLASGRRTGGRRERDSRTRASQRPAGRPGDRARAARGQGQLAGPDRDQAHPAARGDGVHRRGRAGHLLQLGQLVLLHQGRPGQHLPDHRPAGDHRLR